MLAIGKLNSIESLMSQALIDLDISDEELKTIVYEKKKYDQIKVSIGNKIMEMNLVKINCMSNGKNIIILVIAGLIKEDLVNE